MGYHRRGDEVGRLKRHERAEKISTPPAPDSPPPDSDPGETAEWRDAFQALLAAHGPERARYILDELAVLAHALRVGWQPALNTPYVNTVAVEMQPVFPGDLAIEERLASLMRWNALATLDLRATD